MKTQILPTSDVDPDYCADDPCQNGGVCYNITEDYLCVCPSTFSGKNCTDGMFYLHFVSIFTARKRSLPRLCFYRCLSVHTRGGACVVLFWGGMRGFSGGGACVVFSVFSYTMRYGQ